MTLAKMTLAKMFSAEMVYSEVPNRRADRNKLAGLGKNSTLPAFLLSKLINKQGGIFCLFHEELRAGCKENLKYLSEHALLLGTSEYRHLNAQHKIKILNGLYSTVSALFLF